MGRPTRIPGFDYHGRICVFISACTHHRLAAFADPAITSHTLSLLRAAAKEGDVEITAYCFMPDHGHLLLTGLSDESHIPTTVSRWKQFSGYWYSQQKSAKLWQRNYWDYVLREAQNLLPIAQYIVNNPIRAGLTNSLKDYAAVGSDRWNRDDLTEIATAQRPYWWPE